MGNIIGEIQADLDTIAAHAVKQALEVIKLREEKVRLEAQLAATPGLLEACKALVDMADSLTGRYDPSVVEQAESAIARAEETEDDKPDSPDYDGALEGVADD